MRLSSPRSFSLTTRLALWFALLAFIVVAAVGYVLYLRLQSQLMVRDDAALVTRVDQIRTLMREEDVRNLVRDKPQLFANMLGNTESLLVLRFPGEQPLIEVNPGHAAIPDLDPVPAHAPLTLAAVHHAMGNDDTPFIYVAADAQGAEPQRNLQIISGRLMTERTRMLRDYRNQILLLALGAAALAALLAYSLARRGMTPLQRLAAQTTSIGIGSLSTRIQAMDAPSELKPLIRSFNDMLDRLERGFDQLSQVSADMAHDLRTPIGNLMGQTEVGLGKPRDTAYYQRLLGSNFEELQRLSTMIDNMLFLARAEHADHAIDRRALSAQEEFQRLAEYFEGPAEERDVILAFRGEAPLWADPNLLRRALANLLINAIRHAHPGTQVLTMVETVPEGTAIHVENLGPTIPPHHLERLFDRFYRADTSRQRSAESSGLGLAIVRGVMSLHHGTWQASSHQDVTRFTLVFPRAAGGAPP